jgi:predicted amidohydrolase
MQDLKVTLVQTHLEWENPQANFRLFEEKLAPLKNKTDLIILPEMFTTGFTMNAANVFDDNGTKTKLFLQNQASLLHAAICGSVIVKENGQFFNRLYFVLPDGTVFHYDKRHLFRMAKEHEVFSKGKKRLIVTYKGWKICPLICYDLRFPVWSRNHDYEHNQSEALVYDLLIYVANWPAPRKNAWQDLLKARAHENLSYVCGVNRVGKDGNNVEYTGNSAVINFKGETLLKHQDYKDFTGTVNLSGEDLTKFREKFPAFLDKDYFYIIDK